MAPAALQTQWQDEEDLLPFSLFANELELLVGTARGKSRPDPLATLQLLQKLVATLDRTPRAQVCGIDSGDLSQSWSACGCWLR